MDTIGLVTQLALLVAYLVAAGVWAILWLALMQGYAVEHSPATAKERWFDRLYLVGVISVAIVSVSLLIAAFGILWNIGGLGMAVMVVVLSVLGILRWV